MGQALSIGEIMSHPFQDKRNSEIIELINEYIHSERDRVLMKRKLVDNIHFESLAEELDMSTTQVKRIYKKSIETIDMFI